MDDPKNVNFFKSNLKFLFITIYKLIYQFFCIKQYDLVIYINLYFLSYFVLHIALVIVIY